MGERSIRMVRSPHGVNDYVFTDMDHARKWLTQAFVMRDDIVLEEVDVGPLCKCRTCGGAGFRQTIKPIRRLTVQEFLHPHPTSGGRE